MQSPVRTYYLDNPTTGKTMTLGGLSYVWGALLGPFYVLLKGLWLPALAMLAISIGIMTTAATCFTLVASIMYQEESLIGLVLIPPIALFAQGVIAVRLVQISYLRLGWYGV